MIQQKESLYEPSLDGLRTLAFLLVFVHHLGGYSSSPVMHQLGVLGGFGVDLFFVISSFLFFNLLQAEHEKIGKINVLKFYGRRFLRVYPLLFIFVCALVLLFGPDLPVTYFRAAGILLLIDNVITSIAGWSSALPYSSHLWTLSYEFQVYAIVPFAFMLSLAIGKKRFFSLLLIFCLFAMAARIILFGLGIGHPAVWVTPFLRPESIIAGMTLSLFRPTWHWIYSAVICIAAGFIFVRGPLPWTTMQGAFFLYPIGAIMFAALIDTILRCPPLRSFFSMEPLRLLGLISFGLYVFHLLGFNLVKNELMRQGFDVTNTTDIGLYSAYFLLSLGVTIAMATASYIAIEKPFLRIKKRITPIDGRSAGS